MINLPFNLYIGVLNNVVMWKYVMYLHNVIESLGRPRDGIQHNKTYQYKNYIIPKRIGRRDRLNALNTILSQYLSLNDGLYVEINNLLLLPVIVSRLHCESESFKMELILDINSWIYPMDLVCKQHSNVIHRGCSLLDSNYLLLEKYTLLPSLSTQYPNISGVIVIIVIELRGKRLHILLVKI
ncbi:DNA-directed RNA polymerases I, II, and III subunit RPABC3 [Aphis craccivora]|uniref:DNA-directed RNA polymerases I, II, and III subunit RPABC3 n=1 Tax=Aphis craccivora TaxID=307492 RepID=A0A6G0YK88_APHCR|nr:DNA-directed RNA polymerases I, II, and III subunit RPABC3 [Aphis craccivora]